MNVKCKAREILEVILRFYIFDLRAGKECLNSSRKILTIKYSVKFKNPILLMTHKRVKKQAMEDKICKTCNRKIPCFKRTLKILEVIKKKKKKKISRLIGKAQYSYNVWMFNSYMKMLWLINNKIKAIIKYYYTHTRRSKIVFLAPILTVIWSNSRFHLRPMGTLLQPLQETANHYPRNLDICIIYDSVILLQSIYILHGMFTDT